MVRFSSGFRPKSCSLLPVAGGTCMPTTELLRIRWTARVVLEQETTMNDFIRDATAKLVLALVLLAQLFQRPGKLTAGR
jgi:hypothetical protein